MNRGKYTHVALWVKYTLGIFLSVSIPHGYGRKPEKAEDKSFYV